MKVLLIILLFSSIASAQEESPKIKELEAGISNLVSDLETEKQNNINLTKSLTEALAKLNTQIANLPKPRITQEDRDEYEKLVNSACSRFNKKFDRIHIPLENPNNPIIICK